MLDPCGVMASHFEDMSSENKYAALVAALGKGESAGKNCEHGLRESGVGESGSAEGISIETPMQSQMSDGSGAPPEAHAATLGRGHPDSLILVSEYSLRVSCIGESDSAEGSKDDALMPTQLSDGSEGPPIEAHAAADGAPAVVAEGDPVQQKVDATGDEGDRGMDAKDAEEAQKVDFDVMMDGEETRPCLLWSSTQKYKGESVVGPLACPLGVLLYASQCCQASLVTR